MQVTTMEELEKEFEYASDFGYKWIAVEIKMEGYPDHELIINHWRNFEKKLAYYQGVYDESLVHKFAEGISIVGVEVLDELSELDPEEEENE